MNPFRIALANLRFPATPEESIALAAQAIDQASKKGARIICFPECFVPGYRIGKPVPRTDPQFLERAWSAIAEVAAKASITVILGTERFVDGRLVLTALVIDEGGAIAGFQDKVQLDPSEEGAYTPGSGRRVFQAGPVTFGVAICHEGWRYPETVRWAARRGAQIVFHPHFGEAEGDSYRPTTYADPANTFHESAALCRAAENTCYFATVNCASPGLCLLLDEYAYDYGGVILGSESSPVRLTCGVTGNPTIPAAMPQVVWRAGVDINPLDVHDEDDARWLLSCVWPEHVERRERLAAAIALARSRELSLHRGDLVADLPAMLAQVPRDATLVVFHCASLVYVNEEARRHFADILAEASRQRDIVWISNEAPTVLPEITALAPPVKGPRFLLGRTRLTKGQRQDELLAIAQAHGAELEWLAP